MFGYKTLAWIAVLATLVAAAAPASADTFFEGTSYNDSWEYHTTFAAGDLTGYVNAIVYDKDSFPSDYQHSDDQYSGYTPTPGEFTYVYQVFVQGKDELHGFEVKLQNEADNIGMFGPVSGPDVVPNGGPNVVPDGAVLASDSAFWEFGMVDGFYPVGKNQNSLMLVFSSQCSPKELWGDAADGGGDADIRPLPSPGMIVITVPEPSTLWLTLVGLGTCVTAWASRRRQGRKGL